MGPGEAQGLVCGLLTLILAPPMEFLRSLIHPFRLFSEGLGLCVLGLQLRKGWSGERGPVSGAPAVTPGLAMGHLTWRLKVWQSRNTNEPQPVTWHAGP